MANTPSSHPSLFCLALNFDQPRVVLLLHGLLSSHREWELVTAHLPTYHLLIPDLPAHSSSTHIRPCTIPAAAAAHLASILQPYHAQNHPIHVVGLSLGGFVALELARTHPHLVSSLFVTGVAGFAQRPWLMAAAPYLIYAMVSLQRLLPATLNAAMMRCMGLQVSDELQRDIFANLKLATLRSAYASIAECGESGHAAVRTLVVAGGKQDDVESTRKLGRRLREDCAGSRAAVVQGAMHAWNLQWPELFAEAIEAWVEGSELPKEFEELS